MKYNPDSLYQDRTWFDDLAERLKDRLQPYLPRVYARLWSVGFAVFAGVCIAWAAGLAVHAVLFEAVSHQGVTQILAAMLLLVSAKHFLDATAHSAVVARRTARKSILRTAPVPAPLKQINNPPAAVKLSDVAAAAITAQSPPDKANARDFFRQVKAAGVNVRIARALYSAGFRSAEQVRRASDADLLSAKGIGKGTLRKLRVGFGLPVTPNHSASS